MRRYLKLYDTYGWIAIASLMVCTLTGIMLIVPFDPIHAYLSVTTLVTSNPAASLARNLHYWSAQFFLIFTLLHFIEHYLIMNKTKALKKGVWFRLIASMVVIIYVMLSGFILKDDADGKQAFLILSSLLSSVPIMGTMLNNLIAGNEGNLIITYLHHAATGTLIIFMVIFEHVRSFKVKWKTFVVTSAILIAVSLLFIAPLGQQDEIVMKGPWYFLGIQELMHLLTYPLFIVILLLAFLILVYIVPFTRTSLAKGLKIILIGFIASYIVLSFTGYFLRGPMYVFQWPWQKDYHVPVTIQWNVFSFTIDESGPLVEINGAIEGCMTCHGEMKGLSDGHNIKTTGCYSCHGGDPFTLNAAKAHRGMYTVPGNLSNASQTCGGSGCHDDIVERLPKSMMASLSGMIAVNKWVFGEIEQPNGHFNVQDLKNTAADTHLKNLCAGCHIGMEKTTHGNAEWLDRGGGCSGCHLTYHDDALTTLAKLKSPGTESKDKPAFHPSIDINITNDKCESCHSRSGRISLSYEGWHETGLKSIPQNADSVTYKELPDGRILQAMPADVHHLSGMLCIDCHGSYELMGDGKAYMHKEEAVKVQCTDCHTDGTINAKSLSGTDRETQLIAWLRDWSDGDPRIVITSNAQQPLVNTRVNGPELTMLRKADNKSLHMKPVSKSCTKNEVHERLSCESCHTMWVPQCIGCHTSYEKATIGFDMTKKKEVKGTWVEYTGEFMTDYPVLGIKEANKPFNEQKVGIFSPGMIMELQQSTFSKEKANTFHRLYAPVSGHTTQRQSRSCISCHNDPLALGYGRGTLTLDSQGRWLFEPLYNLNANDQLPEDAWTGYMQPRQDASSTRLNMRPFNIKEQTSILRVGACLTCHAEGSKVINSCLTNFEATIHKMTDRCVRMRE